ncbi:MAG: hypothetical protein EXR06_00570 [Rickettsiales bacterium]|nr:hypothetical protein [Rickettsiales bacterium]
MFDERFWLAIAFLGFVSLIVRHVAPIIVKQLDAKSKQISEDLLGAKEMKERAARMLVASEERYKEAIVFADNLVKDSAIEAQKYFAEALKLAEVEIAKKMVAVENRIKQEQESAMREIKIKIIDSALQTVQSNMHNLQKSQASNLVKKATDSVSKLVH